MAGHCHLHIGTVFGALLPPSWMLHTLSYHVVWCTRWQMVMIMLSSANEDSALTHPSTAHARRCRPAHVQRQGAPKAAGPQNQAGHLQSRPEPHRRLLGLVWQAVLSSHGHDLHVVWPSCTSVGLTRLELDDVWGLQSRHSKGWKLKADMGTVFLTMLHP